jgi:hypothetical protein
MRSSSFDTERDLFRYVPFAGSHDNRAKKVAIDPERRGHQRVVYSSDTTREKSTGNIISKAPSVTSVAGGVLV